MYFGGGEGVAALGRHCCMGSLELWRSGATLCCGAHAPHCGGFSCCRAWALEHASSAVAACGL